MISRRLSAFLIFALLPLAMAAGAEPVASEAQRALDRWRASRLESYLNDFGELGRYRAANAALAPPAAGEDRVVFLGDSITDGWSLAAAFPGRPYVNRGISGQTTSQMLLRFRQDVIELRPRVVLILAGTNDLAGNTGPTRLEDIESNCASLAELGVANGIRVILASVLPVHGDTAAAKDYFALRPPAKIAELNRRLEAYCATHGCVYLDYASRMIDARGLLRRELADDGLHPNAAGYAVMAPLAEAAIRAALAARADGGR
jgi:lysophospholipase L1-like esterase